MELTDTKVYIASVAQLSYDRLYAAASAERKAKADRLHFYGDKCRSIAAEALLRHALAQLGIRDFRLETEENGKPYLQNLPVHFSLSHSGDFVLCAVSGAETGCDIQSIKTPDLQLARRFFAPEEAKLTENTPELFYRYWVLKESLGKTLGCGLNEKILRREFDLSGAAAILKDQPALHFKEFSLPGYRCAVCYQTKNISDLIQVVL